MSYNTYRASWCKQVDDYRGKLRMATDEVARFQRQLAEGAQFAPVRDPDELQSLRRTVEELSIILGEEKAELQQLKIQLVYEQQAVKDAEAESEVLRKRHREAENESQRYHRRYMEILMRERELEAEVGHLRDSLARVEAESLRSEEVGPP